MGWDLTGNGGTKSDVDFLGTTDPQPLVIRSNKLECLRIDPDGLRVTAGGGAGVTLELNDSAGGGRTFHAVNSNGSLRIDDGLANCLMITPNGDVGVEIRTDLKDRPALSLTGAGPDYGACLELNDTAAGGKKYYAFNRNSEFIIGDGKANHLYIDRAGHVFLAASRVAIASASEDAPALSLSAAGGARGACLELNDFKTTGGKKYYISSNCGDFVIRDDQKQVLRIEPGGNLSLGEFLTGGARLLVDTESNDQPAACLAGRGPAWGACLQLNDTSAGGKRYNAVSRNGSFAIGDDKTNHLYIDPTGNCVLASRATIASASEDIPALSLTAGGPVWGACLELDDSQHNVPKHYVSSRNGEFVIRDDRQSLLSIEANSDTLLAPAGGKVGIGTATPDEKLTVVGGMRISDSDIWLRNTNDHYHGLGWYGNPKTFAGANVNGPVLYGFDGGALATTDKGQKIALSWDLNGNVGIGTTAPTAPLEIQTASDPAISSQQPALRLTGWGGSACLELKDTATGGSQFRLFNSCGQFCLGDGNGNFFLRIQDPNYHGFHVPHKVNQGDVYLWNLHVSQDVTLSGADCAEEFDVAGTDRAEPGTVLVIGLEGSLRESSEAYDRRVAGVVSGAGDFRHAIVLDKRPYDESRAAVALVGKVCCKVDADCSPIQVGDLLTTSPTPGHAMKATDPLKAFGSVIGKAMAPLGAGRGLIPILIALQ